MGNEIDNNSLDCIKENDRQQALLAWATATIDRVTNQRGAGEYLSEMLDWVAYFTREHFGFQERLLNACSRQQEYVLSRMADHCEFRRKLARLYVDSLCQDPTVPERLRALCHDLLRDAQTHDAEFSDLIRGGETRARPRKRPRRGQLAVKATQLLDPDLLAEAGNGPWSTQAVGGSAG